MYDIRQLKPALYFLLVMGFTGFALAAQAPGLWLLSIGGAGLNAWLVFTKRFRPMPRWLANGITILAFVFIALQLVGSGTERILIVGQFLVLLQLIKLFEQRANRDYAQLLVLSLLLMVAAAISTASLIFGILFMTYLFVSLYCCLLFHLKVESDQARESLALPEERLSPNALRQDQRYLTKSMRRLTAVVSAVAIIMAISVFLFFPRGRGAGLLGPLQFHPSQTLTGFSDQVGFQNIARITQNDELVAHVKVWHNGAPVRGTQPLLLRGITLDVYHGADNPDGPSWQWARSSADMLSRRERMIRGRQMQERGLNPDSDSATTPLAVETAPITDEWKQLITLKPTGTNVLFALPGVVPQSFMPKRPLPYRFLRRDGVLQATETLMQTVEYEVVSTNELEKSLTPSAGEGSSILQRADRFQSEFSRGDPRNVPRRSSIDPKIREFAMSEQVLGDLVEEAASGSPPIALHEEIAERFQDHLRSQFSYTLDLTDAKRIQNVDPIVQFLYDFKRGHCEYFAGAMTLMCQSLGMQARMAVGFRCDEYNAVGEYYMVRQSHAHAWVEVLTADGWKSYDPTSGNEAATAGAEGGFLRKMKHFFDFLEYSWQNNVVAYDTQSRDNLIDQVDQKMTNLAINSDRGLGPLTEWLSSAPFWAFSSRLIGGFIVLMLLGCALAISWFVYERLKLRRRAARIGIDTLPANDQQRLVRQLAFYDDLMQLLEKHHINRPRHQTPLEFSKSLSFLPSEVYGTIHRLTNLFYRIRFGGAKLNHAQRRRLHGVVSRIEDTLGTPPKIPAA